MQKLEYFKFGSDLLVDLEAQVLNCLAFVRQITSNNFFQISFN